MKSLIFYGVFTLGVVIALLNPHPLSSANLTSVRDTLQTSRLSVNARVDATGTAAGSSRVLIKTSASAPANTITTNNLKAQDSVIIGTGTYTIVDIYDTDEFDVSPVLASGDADDNDPVYLKMRPRHVVQFTTATAVANGSFRILLPADATNPNDGNPDDGGYDFNTSVDVTASNVTGYTFGTGVATPYGGTNCTAPTNYHCFDIDYTGAGGVGTTITINIGNTNGSDTPIAPATGTGHTEGTADTYSVIVRNYASGADPDADTPIDATTARVAHIEAVRVTATVDPTINFSIAGIASGATRCGVTTDVTTTATAVPFGTMVLNSFKNLAQNLTVSTNASGGYVVTAAENDELGKDGATSPFIPDTSCDSGPCTISSEEDWSTATNNGFGYSIENVDAASVPFEYDTAGTFDARPFANTVDGDSPQTIFSSTTVANAENAYVCYRLSVGATQAAGDYENQITYTATGTF
jgi:hypothetical protein